MSDPVTRLNAALEGRYAIERELGEGGMATVYLAEDLKSRSPSPSGIARGRRLAFWISWRVWNRAGRTLTDIDPETSGIGHSPNSHRAFQ